MKNSFHRKKLNTNRFGFLILIFIQIILTGIVCSQENELPAHDRQNLIIAARELMEEAKYCALISLDAAGHPQAREMYPVLPDDDMVVWLGTNKNSRKVNEIRNDPRVALYYQASGGMGYVTIRGKAELIAEPDEKKLHFMPAWTEFYPDISTFLSIKVTPDNLEIVSYTHHITGDTLTWAAPEVRFNKN